MLWLEYFKQSQSHKCFVNNCINVSFVGECVVDEDSKITGIV